MGPNTPEFTMKYQIRDAEGDCVDCGIHVHEGTSCDTHEEVLGHYWNPNKMDVDPWNDKYYNTNQFGTAKDKFKLNMGYPIRLTEGRTVVVHAQDGTRIACGVLGKAKLTCFP